MALQEIVIEWDGHNLPKELHKLPPGQYVLEAVDNVTALTPEEEDGILRAMDSIEAGRGISLDEAVRRVKHRSRQR